MKKKITSFAVCLLVLVSLSFSAFFLMAEAHHNCTHDNCLICSCLDICQQTLHQIGSGLLPVFVMILPTIFLLFKASGYIFEEIHETLITDKVRLDS